MIFKTRHLVIFFLSLLIASNSSAIAGDTLSLVTAAKPPLSSTPRYSGVLDKICTEAFHRLGYKIKITVLPGERALINVNAGIDDGDIFRAPGFEAGYPNLVQVPESIGIMEFMAYSKLHFDNFNWSSLKSYSVAYANGWKIYDRNVAAREITKVSSLRELFNLLANGRADIILADRWQARYIEKSMGHNFKAIEPPLATIKMYMYLNKKHKNLIPKLVTILKKMKNDGTIDQYYKELKQSLK